MNNYAAIILDIGTTNCKMSLYQTDNAKLITQKKFRTPKIVEQKNVNFDYQQLWQAIQKNVKSFTINNLYIIEKIIISSVGEMGVLLSKDNTVIGPMIPWHDTRGSEYIQTLNDREYDRVYKITGLPPHSNYSIAKIKWLEEQYAVKWEKGMIWLNLPDFISFLFTGEKKTEYTIASRTMAFDLEKGIWSNEVMEIFNLPIDIMPPICASGEFFAPVRPAIAQELGLSENTKVYIAGHDHMVGSLAVGLSTEEILNSTGTTEGLLSLKNKYSIGMPEMNAKLAGGRYVDPNMFTLFASLPCAGLAFEWFKKVYNYTDEAMQKLSFCLYEEYESNKIDIANSILFLPHLRGDGPPDKNILARGLFYGFTEKARAQDFLYAILQGVCLELRNLLLYFETEYKYKEIKVIGPAVRDDFWLQLKADVLNKNILALEVPETVSLGAFIDCYPELKNKGKAEEKMRKFTPNSQKVKIFENVYKKYKLLYDVKLKFEQQIL